MSTHDMIIADGSGSAVLADLNNGLQALASTSKDSSRPATDYDGQLQLYTATTPWTLDVNDGTDWIGLLHVDATNNIAYPVAAMGNVDGITITNNGSDGDHDIDFSAGTFLTNDNVFVKSSGVITKRIDAAWAAGSGNGGLDTGTVAADTTYHCYMIRKTADGSADAIFSTGTSGPTVMPSGYSGYSRRGAVITNASSNILPFKQFGRCFYLATPISSYSLTTTPSSKTSYTLTVPNGIITEAIFNLYVVTSATAVFTYYYPYHGAASFLYAGYNGIGDGFVTTLRAFTNTSKQVELYCSAAVTVTSWILLSCGWVDYQIEFGA